MGPITLVDKCAVQALHWTEIAYLDRYYSLVISPILLRELLSTLAKEPEENKDWEKTLSILAAKVDTMSSYTPPNAMIMARANLLGHDIPMTGQVPLAGGKTVRSRDGTYGTIFEEQPEKSILREWKAGRFSETNKKAAQTIREMDHAVDLSKLQQEIGAQLNHFPQFDKLSNLVKWLDNTYFTQVSQEFHLRSAALGLLNSLETDELLKRWKEKGQPLFSDFCSYAFYFYRCNTIYFVGLGKGLIKTSKWANTHLDMQYLYYLPFCMVFTSSDTFVLEFAKFFLRPNQVLVPGSDLKKDLKQTKGFFENLTDEQRASVNKELGYHPPEEGAPLTASIWSRLMAPRRKLEDAAPEFSKERNEDIVRQINRYMKDSINTETNRTNDPDAVQKWAKVGLIERGIHFANEAINLSGLSEERDWDEVRRSFNQENVKKIYDLHADIWRPDDDHWSLAETIRAEDRSRFLYLGEVEPEEIVDKVWRWALHFDQILIPDPFQSPWARKPEYNPLSKPVQFETDTLKLVYLLTILYPLIVAKKVVFVPDPSDFNPTMKKASMAVAESLKDNSQLVEAIELDREKLRIYSTKAQMRVYARLPEQHRKTAVKKLVGNDFEPHLKYLAQMRNTDPLCLNSDFSLEEGELVIVRSGASFESSVVLSALYGATPISSLESRFSQYSQAATTPSDHTARVLEQFKQTPGFHFLDPFFSCFAADKGALKDFQETIGLVLLLEEIPAEITTAKVSERLGWVEEDCNTLAEIYAKNEGLGEAQLVGKFPLRIIQSSSGFATNNVVTLAKGWFPGRVLKYPKHFIKLPS